MSHNKKKGNICRFQLNRISSCLSETQTEQQTHSLHEDDNVVDLDAGHGAEGAAGVKHKQTRSFYHFSLTQIQSINLSHKNINKLVFLNQFEEKLQTGRDTY